MAQRVHVYSPSTGCTYIPGIHKDYPSDLILISEDCYEKVIANPASGKVRRHLNDGTPYLADPDPEGVEALCKRVDDAAAECGRAVIGDPLKVLEYERAATAARLFQEEGFPSSFVPPAVAAWAINGRTPEQAAIEIIERADDLDALLQRLRADRLAAKERIRALAAAGDQAEAERDALAAVAHFQGLASAAS